jgi:hypothetical protein
MSKKYYFSKKSRLANNIIIGVIFPYGMSFRIEETGTATEMRRQFNVCDAFRRKQYKNTK